MMVSIIMTSANKVLSFVLEILVLLFNLSKLLVTKVLICFGNFSSII